MSCQVGGVIGGSDFTDQDMRTASLQHFQRHRQTNVVDAAQHPWRRYGNPSNR